MEIDETFDLLIEKACAELAGIQEQGAAHFAKAQFAEAREKAERAARIQELIAELERTRKSWRAAIPAKLAPAQALGPVQPTPHGSKTRPEQFTTPILRALVQMGGKGKADAVLGMVKEIMEEVLSDTDMETLPGEKEPAWRKTARKAQRDLLKKGMLSAEPPAAVWEINAAGRNALRPVKNSERQ